MPDIFVSMHSGADEYLAKINTMTDDQRQAAVTMYGEKVGNLEPIFNIDDGVGVINIIGMLSPDGPDAYDRYFGFSGTGYNEIIEACDQMKRSGVTDIKVLYDTGGGYVSGCERAYKALFSLRETANVVSINKGMMASAGYWLACSAQEIVSESVSNFTGSIGVKVASWDFTEYYKSMGITQQIVLSDNAANKAPEISSEEGRVQIKLQLDAIERVFYACISEGRGISIEKIKTDFGQGAVLIADDPGEGVVSALSCGMIDGIMGAAIKKVSDLVDDESAESESKGVLDNETVNQNGSKFAAKGENMATLAELLASDPEANQEHLNALAAAKSDGTNEANEKNKNDSTKAVAIMRQASGYPEAIQNLACEVVAGNENMASLTAAITTVDSMKQTKASDQAKQESNTLDATQSTVIESKQTNTSEVVSTEEGISSFVSELKSGV